MQTSLTRRSLRVLGRMYPFYSGCGTVMNSAAFVRASREMDTPQALGKLRDGTRIVVNPNEFLGRAIYFSGEWDPKISWAIRRLVRSGEAVVDIGAHCGVTALLAARLVGPGGTVHAFEPQHALAEMLVQSARINGFDHLQVHEVALSSSDGIAELFTPNEKPILASLNVLPGAPSVTVQRRKAGDALQELGGGALALLKIDVEGHELDVFGGGEISVGERGPSSIA
jgi:FkbM family methyltransferase